MRPHRRLRTRGCKTAAKILDPYRPPFFLKFLYAVHAEGCPQGGFSYVSGAKSRHMPGFFHMRGMLPASFSCAVCILSFCRLCRVLPAGPTRAVRLWRLSHLHEVLPLGMGGGSRAGKLLPSARGLPGKLRLRCPPLALTPSLRNAYLISDKNI